MTAALIVVVLIMFTAWMLVPPSEDRFEAYFEDGDDE